MKVTRLLREWQKPIRDRVSTFSRLDTEFSIYQAVANDDGGGRTDEFDNVFKRLEMLSTLLDTSRNKIPLRVLKNLYGGVNVRRTLIGHIYEQLTGTGLRILEGGSSIGQHKWQDIFTDASYPMPDSTPSFTSFGTKVLLRSLDGREFHSEFQTFVETDWLGSCDDGSENLTELDLIEI